MTNIDRWPEAFENGIPKVGGRWRQPPSGRVWTVEGPGLRVVANDGERTTSYADWFQSVSDAFLGFSDSAPVNQGAAAPQKPVDVCRACCSKPATVYWMPTRSPVCAVCDRERGKPEWVREPIGSPAPIVAPPPSLKAAVQQEGLSIPSQTGTRHDVYEKAGQDAERAGLFDNARASAQKARYALPFDLAYDLEADAIRSNRVIKKIALQEMGQGDRRCFDLRGLREFEAIRSAEHALFFWWKS